MKKVKCKNCKYYSALTRTTSGIEEVRVTKYCDPNRTMKVYGGWIARTAYKIKDLIECAEPNKEIDCKYYKRKWWKFWIKEKVEE